MHVQEMISTHPSVKGGANDALIRCIEACYDCAQACTACADACLAEDGIKDLVPCIRFNLDCATVCAASGTILSRRSGTGEDIARAMLAACLKACRLCGAECKRHAAMMEHCRVCADSCQRCGSACEETLRDLGGWVQ